MDCEAHEQTTREVPPLWKELFEEAVCSDPENYESLKTFLEFVRMTLRAESLVFMAYDLQRRQVLWDIRTGSAVPNKFIAAFQETFTRVSWDAQPLPDHLPIPKKVPAVWRVWRHPSQQYHVGLFCQMSSLLTANVSSTFQATFSQLVQDLELFLTVYHRTRHFIREGTFLLNPEALAALHLRQPSGILPLLTVLRATFQADFVYWGRVDGTAVQVDTHLGATNPLFGFNLPIGEGVGGRVVDKAIIMRVDDYLYTPYRYPGVDRVIDDESVRSGLIAPVRRNGETLGVVYVTQRSLQPFNWEDQLVMKKFLSLMEHTDISTPFFKSGSLSSVNEMDHQLRPAWHEAILQALNPEVLCRWLETQLQLQVVLQSTDNHPLIAGGTEKLNHLRHMYGLPTAIWELPSSVAFGSSPGFLYVWDPTGALHRSPLTTSDIITGFTMVLERRVDQLSGLLSMRGALLEKLRQWPPTKVYPLDNDDALMLIPDEGVAYAFRVYSPVWNGNKLNATGYRVYHALHTLISSPVAVLGDIFFWFQKGHHSLLDPPLIVERLQTATPSGTGMLIVGPPFSTRYELPHTLDRVMTVLEQSVEEKGHVTWIRIADDPLIRFVRDPSVFPRLHELFSECFEKLIQHDKQHKTALTRTLCTVLVHESLDQSARKLNIHKNTVTYRIRKAWDILGNRPKTPYEELTWKLAAYAYLHTFGESL